MEERLPIWTVAANMLDKQSRIADKGWFFSFVVGLGPNNSSPKKKVILRNIHNCLELGLILLYYASNGRGKRGMFMHCLDS
jgi:hypothetical protein